MLPPNHMPACGFIADYLLLWYVVLSLAGLGVLAVRRARRGGGRGALIVANLLVLATLAGVAFMAGETWFRFVYDATDSYGLTMTNWAWFRRHFQVNSWGLRDRDWPASKAAGVTRVAVLGDSFVAGYGVPDPTDRFADRVGAALDERSPGRFQIWNAAGVGWSTGDELAFLRDVQGAADFDRVVVAYCLNDVDDLLPAEERFDRLAVPRLDWVNPWQSFLFDFLWFRFRLTADSRVDGYFDWVTRAYEDPAVWGRQESRIADLAAFCASQEIALDAVVFPLFNSWGAEYPFDDAHEKVRAAFAAHGARVLDLRATYEGLASKDLVVNAYDAHPNEHAHELAARAILENLAPGW